MKQRDILFLLISSAILAGIWIVFTIAHNALTSTITPTISQQLIPLSNTFDQKTLQTLQTRKGVTPQFIISVVVSTTPTPTPTLIPISPVNPLPTNKVSTSSAGQGGTQ